MILHPKWGLCALGLMLGLITAPARAMDKIPDEYKTSGFAAGCQAYSYSRGFTVVEAIRLTHEAGGKVIEFYPGQPVSAEINTPLDHKASADVIALVKAELSKNHVLAVNYGVVTPPGNAESRKAEWRQIFE